MKKELKDFLTGLSVLLLYLSSSFILLFIFNLLHININNLNTIQKIIYNLSYEFILILIIILIYRKIIINDLKKFNKSYFSYIKYWFITILLMMISNIIINMFTNINTSSNQEIIIDTFKKAPIYTTILTIIYAPILEELVFRLSFRKMFKTNILFIIISGLFFGFMHVSDPKTLTELIYIIPYSIPGIIFAYTLTKSNNIIIPIGLHFIHNSSMILIQIILSLI